ncbi:hypothetical protein [Paenibacillus silviterrae]|uniref:hypothetical protein n=1 Tax=Paenibacillus silviterrae TaxID=3242194 RepID=UPI0025437455|nr:hypothetical protein [Paenibacillus chinjuensis]
MKISRTFTFWLLLFSSLICLNHLTGHDDKNIPIFMTNPLNMALEGTVARLHETMGNEEAWHALLYALHLGFWFAAGLLVDLIAIKVRAAKK